MTQEEKAKLEKARDEVQKDFLSALSMVDFTGYDSCSFAFRSAKAKGEMWLVLNAMIENGHDEHNADKSLSAIDEELSGAEKYAELYKLTGKSIYREMAGDELKHARLREETAAKAMDKFAARFDGLENFAECLEKTESAKRIDAETSDIRACLARDGLDPDAPVCPAECIGVADGAAGLERKLEELDSRIARIMDSEELDALMDRRSVLATRRAAVLRRGVEAMLACAIARKIDARALDLLPMELDSAGSILSEMTGSECSLRYEGRFMLSVEGEERPLSEAGDGMRTLASLALKVSAAEMIGEGKVPLVLDEVLSGLDPRTKASACRALRGAAKRMQVILLTADQETRDMLAGMPDVTLVTLPLPHKQRDREGPDGMDAGRE